MSTPGERIERARGAASSPQGKGLLAAADELLALARLVERMRAAQLRYWSLRTNATPAQRRELLAASVELETEVDRALVAAGLGRQQWLPVDGEGGGG